MCSEVKEGAQVVDYVGRVIRIEDPPAGKPGMSASEYAVKRVCLPQCVATSLGVLGGHQRVLDTREFTFTVPCKQSVTDRVIEHARELECEVPDKGMAS